VKPSDDGIDNNSTSEEENHIDERDDGEGGGDDPKWTAVVVADFDQHRSAVGRVEWNVTG
jgi:hypothetical protein